MNHARDDRVEVSECLETAGRYNGRRDAVGMVPRSSRSEQDQLARYFLSGWRRLCTSAPAIVMGAPLRADDRRLVFP